MGFPGGSASKESTCNAERPGLDPWVGKIPWRKEWLPTPLFWPGEFHGLHSPCGCKELDMTATFNSYVCVCVCVCKSYDYHNIYFK